MPTSKRLRVVQTSVVLLVMMNTGFNIGIFSPTFPDIEVLTSTNTAQMSITLIWTGIASVVGALVIGPLFGRVNGMLLMFVCLLLEGLTMGLAPIWPNLTAFQSLAALTCVFNFAIMSGCMSVNRGLWKSSVVWLGPVIQTTDLMHALGTALVPQVIRPFITGSPRPSPLINASSTSPCIAVISTEAPTDDSGSGLHSVQMAYLVVALFDAAMAIVCLVTCAWEKTSHSAVGGLNGCYKTRGDDDETLLLTDASETSANRDSHPWNRDEELGHCTRFTVLLLVLVYLFFVVNGGRDALLTGLLFTYVDEYLEWTVASGTLLVTMYHVTRVVVHAILVPVSRFVSSSRLMIFNVLTLIVSSTLMLAALVGGDVFTTVGVITTGLATSNIHPTTITLVDETVHVIPPVMALFISAIGLGQIVVAPLSGKLLLTTGVVSFPALLVALAVIGAVLFVAYSVVIGVMSTERGPTSDVQGSPALASHD